MMSSARSRFVSIVALLLISLLPGCMVFPLESNDPDQSLNWCPPLPNCVSTEAFTPVHSIRPFKLAMDWQQAWPIIQDTIKNLEGTHIVAEHTGYIYAKSYSRVFKFLDYIEVLAVPEHQQLSVRSGSLLGISDLFVNYSRTEDLREQLENAGVIEASQ